MLLVFIIAISFVCRHIEITPAISFDYFMPDIAAISPCWHVIDIATLFFQPLILFSLIRAIIDDVAPC